MNVIHFRLRVGLMLLVCCASIIVVQQARADMSLSFANVPGTKVTFAGGTFSFSSNGSGDQFVITDVEGGPGNSAIGFDGFVSPSGTQFAIGTVTPGLGGAQSAPVTGSGQLNIVDGSSVHLLGNIVWDSIGTVGLGGTINLVGTVNLTGITYLGSDPDLDALAGRGFASDVITFQFSSPGKTLTQLKTDGGSSSYSGLIAIPEPATIFAGALLLLPFGASTLRVLRKRQVA